MRFPTTTYNRIGLITAAGGGNVTMHALVWFNGQLNADRLIKSILLMYEQEPILSYRYVDRPWRPDKQRLIPFGDDVHGLTLQDGWKDGLEHRRLVPSQATAGCFPYQKAGDGREGQLRLNPSMPGQSLA